MLGISAPQFAIWIVSILSEGWLLAILIGRKRAQQFPYFTAYVGFLTLRSLILFALACYERSDTYFYVYYAAIPLEAAFLAMTGREVAFRVFHPWITLPPHSKKVFTYILVGFGVFSGLAVCMAPQHPSAIMAIGRALERLLSVATFGWFSSLAILSKYLHLPWRRHVYGIGAGFLINLSVQSVTLTMWSGFGSVVGYWLRYTYMLGFTLSLVAWLVYFWNPEPELRLVTKSELERIHSFISTVEDVLNRKRLLKEIPQRDGLTSKLFPPKKNGARIERTNSERLASGND